MPLISAVGRANRLPTESAHQAMKVKPGDRLQDGFEKIYKFLAINQPVDHPRILLTPTGDTGLTVGSTVLPNPAHPFSVGIYTKDNSIKAAISTGKVNGLLVAPQKLKQILQDYKISCLPCSAVYEGRGVFDASGQAAEGMEMMVILIVKVSGGDSPNSPVKIDDTDFKIIQLSGGSIPLPPQGECHIPLTAVDKNNQPITLIRNHIRLDIIRADGKYKFWFCSL